MRAFARLRSASSLTAWGLCAFARTFTSAQTEWRGCTPDATPRIYFGNHSSHGDFVLVWASLPPALRASTRPVAGSDYWQASGVRRWMIHDVLNAVLVDRGRKDRGDHLVASVAAAIDAGDSLILFPEGTRNVGDDALQPFKTGIFHVAKARPRVECVPVWIENAGRAMPKGAILPLPLLCTLTFGAPLRVDDGEAADAFLHRLRAALLALRPQRNARQRAAAE